MCSIIGSFSKSKFEELIKINSNRGSFSHSLTIIDPNTYSITKLIKQLGPFDLELLNSIRNNNYNLGHIQAPIGGLINDKTKIHPSQIGSFYLLHNGILKTSEINNLNRVLQQDIKWDTKLLLYNIINNYDIERIQPLINSLSKIDGSFACILIINNINAFIFRNSTSILHYDEDLNISSNKFKNSNELPCNTFFQLNLKNKTIIELGKFNNINNPYFFNT